MPRNKYEEPITFVTPARVLIFAATLALGIGFGMQRRNMLFLGAGLGAIVIISVWKRPDLKRIHLSRSHLPNTIPGERLRVSLEMVPHVKNKRPISLLQITDTFSAGDRRRVRAFLPLAFSRDPAEKKENKKPELLNGTPAARPAIKLNYAARVHSPRGLHVLGPVHLEAADPLGLFPTESRLDHFSEVCVYPIAGMLREYSPLDTEVLRHVGERAIPRPGLSQEFLHVREYRHGDSPRLIHWPSTARQGDLFVKALEENTMTEVTILLDLFRISHTGIGNVTTTEALVQAAAAVGALAIDRCHLARLVILNDQARALPLGGSQAHLLAMLRELALVRPGGKSDPAEAARRVLPRLSAGGTLVVVVAATSLNENFEQLMLELQGGGLRVAVVLLDDRSYPTLFLDQWERHIDREPAEEIALRLASHGFEVSLLARGDNVLEKMETATATV